MIAATVFSTKPMRMLVHSRMVDPSSHSVYADKQQLEKIIAAMPNEPWVETAGPFHSPTHWNYQIRSYLLGDLERYADNHEKVDIEMEQRELGEDVDVVYDDYKPGEILAKIHTSEKEPGQGKLITLMIKEYTGYDAVAGNWRYMEIEDGRVILNGNSQDPVVRNRCVVCHSGVAHRQYVFHNYMHNSLKVGRNKHVNH